MYTQCIEKKCCRHLKSISDVLVFLQWSADAGKRACLVIPGLCWILVQAVAPVSAKDVQVDRRGFSQSIKDFLNVFDVQSLLRFSLPAA